MSHVTFSGKIKVETSPQSQAGAILILVAVLIFAIFACVGLAIDLYVFSSQKVKYEQTVEQASLSALRMYLFAKSEGKSDQVAEARALSVAENLVGTNISQDFTRVFQTRTNATVSDLGSRRGANGKIEIGVWDFAKADADNCEEAGCFTKADQNTPGQKINSVHVTLRTNRSTRLRTIFAGVFGAQQQIFEVSATAAIVPRRIIFGLDLSRSVIRDNYLEEAQALPEDPDLGVTQLPASEYAYDMADATEEECQSGEPLQYHSMGMASLDAITFGAMPDTDHQTGSLVDNQKMHVKSDYQCFSVPNLQKAHYAINTKTAKDPEPLTSILKAIHAGLVAFANSGVPGNQIGMLGFDDEILTNRTFPLTQASERNPEYKKMLDATDTRLPISDRVQYFLFPRFWGGRSYYTYDPATKRNIFQRMPAMTDLSMGLNKARDMLAVDGSFTGARNDVVLFSDGLANCPSSAWSSLDGQFPCADNDAYVERSLVELYAVRAQYVKDGIVLHTFLAGDAVGPHYLLRKNARGGCLWLDTAKFDHTYAKNMVNYQGGSIDQPPYYRPNFLYIPVFDTGGTWSPLVSPCQDSKDLTQPLDEQCDSSDLPHGGIITVPNITDNQGRVKCNVQGKNKEQQVEDLIRKLVAQTPFVLVQ